MEQIILNNYNNYQSLTEFFQTKHISKILVVCDSAFRFLGNIRLYIENLFVNLNIETVFFSDFQPNPNYESVVNGIASYKNNQCDSILAIGGGSAIDVAKCIKLYVNLPDNCDYLQQTIVPNDIPFIAIPTTAGTGSEATRYAVIYKDGEKQSITDKSIIPSVVLFDENVLETLPDYQRKSTMLDAFCHAIESYWSVNSTDESKEFSKKAISLILENYESYLNNDSSANRKMLEAANVAGKAINITQTTGGHAMCYKLTSLYNIAHGHAAALCVSVLWPYMIENTDKCCDPRGKEYLDKMFEDLSTVLGGCNSKSGADTFNRILLGLKLNIPVANNEDDYAVLAKSVNPVRLKNNPIKLDEQTIENLYRQILRR